MKNHALPLVLLAVLGAVSFVVPIDDLWSMLGLGSLPMLGLVVRGVRTHEDLFDYAFNGSTTPGHNGWTIKDTSGSGTPTYVATTEDGGGLKLTHVTTPENAIVTLYQNDVLIYDLADLQFVDFVAKVSGINSVTTLVMGLASAQNDTPDSVATNAWFRIEGGTSTSAIVVETDDGTTDNDDKATGQTLGSTPKLCRMDFTNGLSDVRFFVDGERVAEGTTFDMSNVTAGTNVQPFVQIQKASGAGVPSITLLRYRAQYKYAYGA